MEKKRHKFLGAKRLGRVFRLQVCRTLGMERKADILYTRLVEGWLSRREVEALYDFALAADGPGDIAEVGSWKGKSTTALGLAVKRSGRADTVYAIDHHIGSEEQSELIAKEGSTFDAFLANVKKAGVDDVVHPLKMDSMDGARWLKENDVSLKLLFLDGAHDYENVKKDLLAYFPLLRVGGVMLMDDAKIGGAQPGVHKAFQEVAEGVTSHLRWAGGTLVVRKTAELPEHAPAQG